METSQRNDADNQISNPNGLFFIHRSLKVTAIWLAFILGAFVSFNSLVLAQTPATFEVSIEPQAEFAVAGQPFTYTIVITNIGREAVNEVAIITELPTGTTLIDLHQNAAWLVGGPGPGKAGVIVWNTLEPMAPTQVATFELVVNILPEMIDRSLVSKECLVISKQGAKVLGEGQFVTSQVLAAQPTPTALPSATATTPATATPVPLVTTPTPTVQLAPPTTVAASVKPASAAESALKTPSRFSSSILLILVVFGAGFVGLTWFLKRR